MFKNIKDYHIVVVPSDKRQTKAFKVSALTLKILLCIAILSIPLFFISVLSTIHYQNKLITLKRVNYENRELIKNRNELVFKIAKLEKNMTLLDDSISHLGELMDIDPQSLKFGTGPIADLDIAIPDDDDEIFSIPGAEDVIDEWVGENGNLTVNKFNRKFSKLKEDGSVLNKKLEEIFLQNKEKINFVNATPNMMPVEGWVTSEFGMRKHPLSRAVRMHDGIDIASPVGTVIRAPSGGKVVFAGRSGGYGNLVVVQHGYGITTLFGHLSKLSVKVGEMVRRGDVIAQVGTTGSSTGPHLHYEVQVDGIPSDPLAFVVQ